MQILEYKYIKPTVKHKNYYAIEGISRDRSSIRDFISLAKLDITLTVPTGIIYIDGCSVSQSESGISLKSSGKYNVAIKSGSSYLMHKWISTFKNNNLITTATVTSSTCASAIQAVYEADRLIELGICKEVILIGAERITEETIRLFRELKIDIMCGDGFVYIRLGKGTSSLQIDKPVWKYAYSTNPFHFSRDTIDNLIPDYKVDYVKLHGTGTKSNDLAEEGLEMLATPLRYKNLIGHTQGISALIETCMVIDYKNIQGTTMVVANGLGGYYGSFRLTKGWL